MLAYCSLATLFSAAAHADEGDYILHSFGQGTDGQRPSDPLIKVDGLFYGTTPNGGTYGTGTIYSMTPQGVEKVLYNFGGTTGDASVPYCALTYVDGIFYGTSSMGGANHQGAVFSFTPAGGEKVLYSFMGGSDGYGPSSELFYFDGALYGTAGEGSHHDGVVFKVKLDGTESIVHTFSGGPGDGAGPSGGLIESGGVLYGLTATGGSTGNGTVYALTNTGSFSLIYSFQGGTADGSFPSGDLLDVGGTLYGTTREGGFYSRQGSYGGYGTVFSVTPAGLEKVIHSFGFLSGKQPPAGGGQSPYAGLIQVGGMLYGTTAFGGNHNGGVVFAMTLQGAEKIVHSSLGGTDGSGIFTSLKNGGDALYGVMYGGGANNEGVVFRLVIPYH